MPSCENDGPRPAKSICNCVELQADIDAFLAKLPEKYSSRDLAMYMNDLFSEIRETRRRIIENQLARVRTLPSGEYQALEATDLPQPSARTLPKAKVPSPRSRRLHRPRFHSAR